MLNFLNDEVVFVGAARTPVGAYLGDLKTVKVQELGVIALNEAIKRSGIDKNDIDEVIVGHVTGSQTTNNLGNIIGIDTGLKHEATGMTVNRICGSGMQSAVSGALELLEEIKKLLQLVEQNLYLEHLICCQKKLDLRDLEWGILY